MLHRAGHARVVLHRPDALVQVHQLPQCHIQTANPPTDWRRQRPFDRHAEVHRRLHRIVGQPFPSLAIALLARQHLIPLHLAPPVVRLLHRRVEYALRGPPDVPPRPIALYERNDRMVGNGIHPVRILDCLAVCRDRNSVVIRLHMRVSLQGSGQKKWPEID